MTMVIEPKAEEKNGVVFFDIPWDVSSKDWFSLHDESDYIADDLDNCMIRVYCYAKNGLYNAELEKVAKAQYPEKVIYNGMGVSFGGIWL